MNADEIVLDHLTERIIGSALTVSNALGAGFLETVYENALVHELRKAGLAVAQQRFVTVMYDGVIVGDYAVDLLVQGSVIVELKAIMAVAENPSRPMHQRPSGNEPASLPAVQRRQPASGHQAHRPGPVTHWRYRRSSAFIGG